MFRRRPPRTRAAPAPPPPVSPPPKQDPRTGGLSHEAVEQLQSLAQLHDQGILTDQEFEQQKAKILGA
jgi:putative oligomerization/nucleic acid binding protein